MHGRNLIMKKIILSQRQICNIIIHNFSYLNNLISLICLNSEIHMTGSIERIINEHQYSGVEIINTVDESHIWMLHYSKYPIEQCEVQIQTSNSYVYVQDDDLYITLTEPDLLSFLIDYFIDYDEEIKKNLLICSNVYAESFIGPNDEINVQIFVY